MKKKKNDNLMKKYEKLLHHLVENSKCEDKLKLASRTENHNGMSATYFSTIKLDLLKSFVRVRLVKNSWILKEKDIPNVKGKPNDINNTKLPMFLEVACNARNNLVITKEPAPPILNNSEIRHIVAPSIAQTVDVDESKVTEDYVKNYFRCISNLKDKGTTYMNE